MPRNMDSPVYLTNFRHNLGLLQLSLTAKFHIFNFLKLMPVIIIESLQEGILKPFSKI